MVCATLPPVCACVVHPDPSGSPLTLHSVAACLPPTSRLRSRSLAVSVCLISTGASRRSLRVEGSALLAPTSTFQPPKSAFAFYGSASLTPQRAAPGHISARGKVQITDWCGSDGWRMAHGMASQGKVTIAVDEYSSNPTQAFTHYNINQSRFQPPHVHMVDPVPYDTPKPTGHTRFVCVSDTHSRTDGIQMPYGDVLLHSGDFTELGLPSEVKKFNDWLGSLPYEFKVVIAGNHELTFDKDFMAELVKQDYYRFPSVSKLKPEDFDDVQSLLTNCVYLQDSDVTVKGFRIYGTPWTPWFNGWGFNLPRGQSLLDKWNQVPEGVDILLTHGPPLGFRDWVPKELQRVGCVELLNTVQRRVRPKLHAFGGIHEGYGIMTDGYTTYINASTCTVSFQPTNPPIIFDLPNPQGS
ncbi:hypothetical protein COCON_G00213980 [Conger conger]|uniref:Metallophosphoesterase MPPED2 n=2 Tax=Conger conger TaxID=82655 RepID=A0A9Q1CXM7_CONCO|nr:hypothetical protein COCON_G00213980 [Conger conger]